MSTEEIPCVRCKVLIPIARVKAHYVEQCIKKIPEITPNDEDLQTYIESLKNKTNKSG